MGGATIPAQPDQAALAAQGIAQSATNYADSYQLNALASEGGKGYVNGKFYDFTGAGDAANQGAVSSQLADAMLAIQSANGPQQIAQSIANLKQSDPIGYAAHQQLFDQIMTESQNPTDPNQLVSTGTQNQILSLLGQGSNLSTGPQSETEAVQQGVRGQQTENGIFLGNAPASQEASAVEGAGEAQQNAVQQQALQFQQSGVDPADVQYRMMQQNLANLGAYINGQTPEAQFGSVAGAGNGAVAFNGGQPNSASMNPNAGLQAVQLGNQVYQQQAQFAGNQANPFLAGLSGLGQAAGFANQAYTGYNNAANQQSVIDNAAAINYTPSIPSNAADSTNMAGFSNIG
jgi:hypothetical protein